MRGLVQPKSVGATSLLPDPPRNGRANAPTLAALHAFSPSAVIGDLPTMPRLRESTQRRNHTLPIRWLHPAGICLVYAALAFGALSIAFAIFLIFEFGMPFTASRNALGTQRGSLSFTLANSARHREMNDWQSEP